MRCKLTNCHANEMHFNYVILHITTNHLNSKANLTTLLFVQVEGHTTPLSRLKKAVSIGQPSLFHEYNKLSKQNLRKFLLKFVKMNTALELQSRTQFDIMAKCRDLFMPFILDEGL